MGTFSLALYDAAGYHPAVEHACLLVAPPEAAAVAYATGLHVTDVAADMPAPPPSSGIVVCLPQSPSIPDLPPDWTGVWARTEPLPAGAWVPLVETALSDVQAFGAALRAADAWRRERCRFMAGARAWAEKAERAKALATALTAEHDLQKLLALILLRAREFVPADAGSLYLVKQDQCGRTYLHVVLAQNDSVQGNWQAHDLPLEPTSIAGAVARCNEVVNIEDVYALSPRHALRHNARFDAQFGYRTRSLVGLPLVKRDGEVLGVLQLINRKPWPRVPLEEPVQASEAMPFSAADVDILRALASLVAVSLEKDVLYKESEALLQALLQPRWLQ